MSLRAICAAAVSAPIGMKTLPDAVDLAAARALHFEGSRVQDRTKQRDHSFIDPNHEPIRVVDVASFHHPAGGKLDVTLCATVHQALSGDRTTVANIVTARLRLDLGMARAMVEGLSKQIAMAEAAGSTKN